MAETVKPAETSALQEIVFPFEDEAAKDPSFTAFRKTLQEAVHKRDHKAIIAMMDEHFKCSFEETGKENCIIFLGLDKNGKIELTGELFWDKMNDILKLGSSKTEAGVSIPYYFEHNPPVEDILTTGIITEKTMLQRKPRYTAHGLRDMKPYEVVTLRSVSSEGWQGVTTFDGIKGYVKQTKLYQFSTWRAFFAKVGGHWKMQFFLEGC
ncbi:MAG: hypothetical protein U1E36_00545 [Rickettsiales bacterium]